jgi:hypothetical protein
MPCDTCDDTEANNASHHDRGRQILSSHLLRPSLNGKENKKRYKRIKRRRLITTVL